jgi:hypothetical protein
MVHTRVIRLRRDNYSPRHPFPPWVLGRVHARGLRVPAPHLTLVAALFAGVPGKSTVVDSGLGRIWHHPRGSRDHTSRLRAVSRAAALFRPCDLEQSTLVDSGLRRFWPDHGSNRSPLEPSGRDAASLTAHRSPRAYSEESTLAYQGRVELGSATTSEWSPSLTPASGATKLAASPIWSSAI